MIKPRKSIRFKPDPLTVALIDLSKSKIFTPAIVGIVINESYTGCALVAVTDIAIKKGAKIKIQVGQIPALKAEIMWIKTLEENILKIGVRILD